MNLSPKNDTLPDSTHLDPQVSPDPEAEELQKQVMAHVREFGPRKYLAFYNRAKQLKESGLEPIVVRRDLIGEIPSLPPVPEGGRHFISKVVHAKQKAFYHVVRNAVEDALARRPPQFREEHSASD
jgi:hypothetical protein